MKTFLIIIVTAALSLTTLTCASKSETISFTETLEIEPIGKINPPKDVKGHLQFIDTTLETKDSCFSGEKRVDGTFAISADKCKLPLNSGNAGFALKVGYDEAHYCKVGVIFTANTQTLITSAVPDNCLPSMGFAFQKITHPSKHMHHHKLYFIKT